MLATREGASSHGRVWCEWERESLQSRKDNHSTFARLEAPPSNPTKRLPEMKTNK